MPSKPRVHFTIHACRLIDPEARPPDRATYGVNMWGVCPISFHSRTVRFTTRMGDVTCRTCRDTLARDKQDLDGTIASTWMACCRDRGASSPLPDRTDELLRAERRQHVLDALEHLSDPWKLLALAMLEGDDGVEAFRDALGFWWEELPEAVRTRVTSSRDQLLLAADVLEEINRLFVEARPAIGMETSREIEVQPFASMTPRDLARARCRATFDRAHVAMTEVPRLSLRS